jgi:glucokinase-like ROK family protein
MKNYRTGNYSHLRHQNLVGVMHYLYENAPISRVDLSRLTKLNKTTVSSLVDELLENEFILEVGIEKTRGAGRSSVLLDINPAHGYIVSGEVGGNYINVICTDFSARIIWQHKEPLEKAGWADTREQLLEILQRGVDFAKNQGSLLGLALGVHGLFDKETGTLLLAPNSGWQDVPLLSILRERFQTEIFVDNEANLAAIGEQFFGSAKGYSDVLYISLGRGLGGGIVHNGEIYNGETGIAGEFGHITINAEGLLCSCGNYGCWETEVNQAAIVRHLTALTTKNSSEADFNLSIADIIEAAERGDRSMLEALNRVGRQLGIGLASLLNTLNPGLIVFGGELSAAADYLLPAARSEMEKRSLKWALKASQMTVARFGSNAAIMGGVGIIFQSVLRKLSGLKRNGPKSPGPKTARLK